MSYFPVGKVRLEAR